MSPHHSHSWERDGKLTHPEITARDIVTAYLRAHGFDGLYQPGECGCELDDLAPCCETPWDCRPGVKVPCNPETCLADGECAWHIGPSNPTPGAP